MFETILHSLLKESEISLVLIEGIKLSVNGIGITVGYTADTLLNGMEHRFGEPVSVDII